jgi:hypothetical protein
MSRNAAGTFSLTAGQPVVSGTVIASATFNTLMSDIATEITDSLDRSGKGGMLAALRGIDGTVAAPSFAFTNETGTGFYRIGASDVGFAIAGTKVAEWTATGFASLLFGPLTATSAVVKGAFADGASAIGVVLDNTIALANATARLASFRSNGTEALAIRADGAILNPVADGASAIGLISDTVNTLSNASAKLRSWKNGGVEKASIDKAGKATFVGVDAGSQKITSVATPTVSTDAATKGYADALPTMTAWALITLGAAGAATITRGFNVASASWSTIRLTVNFTSALANANYAVTSGIQSTGNSNFTYLDNGTPPTTGGFTLFFSQANVVSNFASGQIVSVMVVD